MKTNNRFKTKILILVLAFLPFLFNACSSDSGNDVAEQEQEQEDTTDDDTNDDDSDTIDLIATQIGQDIIGESSGDNAGSTLALNADGTRVAIGARFNDENGTSSGQVRVFEDIGGQWQQIGNDIDGQMGDTTGSAVALNGNGTILAVGERRNMDAGVSSGRIRVFIDINGNWEQIGNNINGEAGDLIGSSLSLNVTGNVLAIGIPFNDNNGTNSGQVKVFQNNGGNWEQLGNEIEGLNTNDRFGQIIDLNDQGNILSVGAPTNNPNNTSGQARVFENINDNWVQIGNVINAQASIFFGGSISINGNGNIIAVGATRSNTTSGDGLVRVFENNGGQWQQIGSPIMREGTNSSANTTISLNNDGSLLAVGIPRDDNGQSGIMRVYQNVSGAWEQVIEDINGNISEDLFGSAVCFNSDGSVLAIGAPGNEDGGTIEGYVRVFSIQ